MLLGITVVPREIEDNGCAKSWGGGGWGVKKVKQMKLCANGSYNFQHIGSCCVPLHVAKRLTGVKLCATTPKNTQQHAITESSAV